MNLEQLWGLTVVISVIFMANDKDGLALIWILMSTIVLLIGYKPFEGKGD